MQYECDHTLCNDEATGQFIINGYKANLCTRHGKLATQEDGGIYVGPPQLED